MKDLDPQDDRDPDEPAFVQVPAARGWGWIRAGWEVFSLSRLTWIAMLIAYAGILFVASSVPVVNLFAGLFAPVFSGGFMIACQRAEYSGEVNFNDLFAGFRESLAPLLMLGVLFAIGSFLVLMFGMGLMGGAMIDGAGELSEEAIEAYASERGVFFAIGFMVLLVPLLMAQWFAPALVALDGVSPWRAVVLSFKASLRNLGALTVFGLVTIPLAIAASLPLMLGWVILVPLLILASYCSWKEVFGRDSERARTLAQLMGESPDRDPPGIRRF